MQVKNKYLKESKINARRMTAAMAGGSTSVAALTEAAPMLKRDVDDADASEKGAAAASGSAVATGVAGPGGDKHGGGVQKRSKRKTKEQKRADGEDSDSIFDGEAADPTMERFLY